MVLGPSTFMHVRSVSSTLHPTQADMPGETISSLDANLSTIFILLHLPFFYHEPYGLAVRLFFCRADDCVDDVSHHPKRDILPAKSADDRH